MIRVLLVKIILKLLNWRFCGFVPTENKALLVVAPHTSSWDYVFGRLLMYSINKRAYFTMNKKFFFFPLGIILRATGGIPVDSKSPKRFLSAVKWHFENKKNAILLITPEGTRKRNKNWKKGFHLIAKELKVPVLIGILDYKKREAGIIDRFEITENADADLVRLKEHYKDSSPKYPEKFAI